MESSDDARTLRWEHGSLGVQRLGAMLAPVRFKLHDGSLVEPLHIPAWADTPLSPDLPGVVRGLRGEWPCVPFGHDRRSGLVDDWADIVVGPSVLPAESPPHGVSANSDWDWVESAEDRLSLRLIYPSDHPIEWVEREIMPDHQSPAVDCHLKVMPRADCRLPLGVHPTLALPKMVGAARLSIPSSTSIRSFPGSLEEGSEIFRSNAVCDDIRDVPAHKGGTIDASALPLEGQGEDLLQLVGVETGQVFLDNPEQGYRFSLTWSAADFPSLLIWFSNRGRHYAPWNGEHAALGLEPICSAFDLGERMASADNPIARQGIATACDLKAGQLFQTTYRMAAEWLG